jgi:hypothetical protein
MPFRRFVSPKRRKARKALRPFLIQVRLLRKGEKGGKAQYKPGISCSKKAKKGLIKAA